MTRQPPCRSKAPKAVEAVEYKLKAAISKPRLKVHGPLASVRFGQYGVLSVHRQDALPGEFDQQAQSASAVLLLGLLSMRKP